MIGILIRHAAIDYAIEVATQKIFLNFQAPDISESELPGGFRLERLQDLINEIRNYRKSVATGRTAEFFANPDLIGRSWSYRPDDTGIIFAPYISSLEESEE